MDTFSAAERSDIMRRVKSRNTTPERIVRRFVRSFGYRQQLNCEELPGCPDIALPGKRIAIFVHGCFWHGHHCPAATLPKSNRNIWF
jgi:DNA mismatch endonuclease, patch repair protein